MDRRVPVALLLLTSLLGGCADSDDPESDDSTGPGPDPTPPARFAAPLLVDDARWSGEPSLVVDSAGGIYITGAGGTTRLWKGEPQNPEQGYGQSYLWKSDDGGASFRHLDLGALRYRNGSPGVEGDLALDADDAVYFVDLPVASVSLSVSKDAGATWTQFNPAVAPEPGDDRPWVTAYGKGHVWISYLNLARGIEVLHSADGGVLFGPPVDVGGDSGAGRIVVDSTNGNHLYIPMGNGDVAVSHDGGRGWHLAHPARNQPNYDFPAAAVDDAGVVYLVWADNPGHGAVIQYVYSFDHGASWSMPYNVTTNGTVVFPWITAGDAGRIAIVWYGSDAGAHASVVPAEAEWRVHAAIVEEANTSAPRVDAHVLTPTAIKRGPICVSGLACVLDPDADRRLLDFFQVATGPDGRIHVAYTDIETKGAPRIAFVQQTGGPDLRGEPSPA